MRVLERCIPSAAPEVKVQIDALRQAFSNDTSKAFELKPDLGLRSPSVESKPTPPGLYSQGPPTQGGQGWAQMQDTLSSKTISPSNGYGQQFQQPPAQAMPYTTTGFPMQGHTAYSQQALPQISTAPTGYPLEPVISNEQQQTPVWDPSGIFSQWNNAFGPPAQAQQTPPAAAQQDPRMQLPTSAPAMPPPPQQQQQQQSPQHVYSQQMPAPSASMMPTVTPVMWQNAFTDAYVSGHGHKRFRDDGGGDGYGGYQKRRG